jgi:hypothetical protein
MLLLREGIAKAEGIWFFGRKPDAPSPTPPFYQQKRNPDTKAARPWHGFRFYF